MVSSKFSSAKSPSHRAVIGFGLSCLIISCALFCVTAQGMQAATNQRAEEYFKRAQVEMDSEPMQDKALRDLEMAIKIAPDTAKYHATQAHLLFTMEEDEAALKAADKAIRLDPKCCDGWFVKAKALGRLRRPAEGLQCMNEVIPLSPRDAGLFVERARLLVLLNKWADGEKDLDSAVSLSPGLGTAYADRIKACEHLNEWPKVVSDCTTLLKVDSAHHDRVYRSRAGAYVAMHDYAKAVNDLKQSLRIWPDDIRVHQDLQSVYKTIGDKKGVAEEEEKIKSLKRDF